MPVLHPILFISELSIQARIFSGQASAKNKPAKR